MRAFVENWRARGVVLEEGNYEVVCGLDAKTQTITQIAYFSYTAEYIAFGTCTFRN